MHLSEHFTLAEASLSQIATRLGIDNTPPKSAIPALKHVAEHILEPVRDVYGHPISPNSWYRCRVLNKTIGSKSTSQHIKGQAVDLDLPRLDNHDLYQFIKNNLTFDQLILEYYRRGDPNSGWVHVSYHREGQNRCQAFMIYDRRDPKP